MLRDMFCGTIVHLSQQDFAALLNWNWKETTEAILKEDLDINEEIQNLVPCKIMLNERLCIYIKYQLHLTVIDGKVLNALTNTKSFQACPICNATPKDFLGNKNLNCL